MPTKTPTKIKNKSDKTSLIFLQPIGLEHAFAGTEMMHQHVRRKQDLSRPVDPLDRYHRLHHHLLALIVVALESLAHV